MQTTRQRQREVTETKQQVKLTSQKGHLKGSGKKDIFNRLETQGGRKENVEMQEPILVLNREMH